MNIGNFEKIVKDYGPKLYGYVYKFVHNREDAEDILQSVFLSFHSKMERVDEEKVSSYLYRACHNRSLDFLKKRKKFTLVAPLDFKNLAEEDKSSDEKIKEENSKLIHMAIAKLPVKMAMLIEMKNFRKLSYKEISEETGLSVKAIESQLVRARKKMRKEISKYRP